MKKRITIIGSGLAGMACAAYLAKQGHEVQVIEKNRTYGGRLQTYEESGFVFDSGRVSTQLESITILFLPFRLFSRPPKAHR